MSLFSDAHTHVHRAADPGALLAAATLAGVTHVVDCATHAGDWAAVVQLHAAHAASVLPGLGIHPWWAGVASTPDLGAALDALRGHLMALPAAHVGEIGVDRSPRGLAACPLDAQVAACRGQLRLASALRRPVSVHCVRAVDDVAALLVEAGAGLPGVVMHSWGGSRAAAARIEAAVAAASPGAAVVFSFQGAAVVPAAASVAIRRLLLACAPLPPSVPRGDVGAAGPPSPHRVPYSPPSAIAALVALPPALIVFETDAPDQGEYAAPALAWEGVDAAAARSTCECGGGGGAVVTPAAPKHVIANSDVAAAFDLPSRQVDGSDGTAACADGAAAAAPTEASRLRGGGAATTITTTGDGGGGAETGEERYATAAFASWMRRTFDCVEHGAPRAGGGPNNTSAGVAHAATATVATPHGTPHGPHRILAVVRAAAVLRAMAAAKVKAAGRARGGGGTAGDALPAAPRWAPAAVDAAMPSADAVRSQYALLAEQSTANVLRVLGAA